MRIFNQHEVSDAGDHRDFGAWAEVRRDFLMKLLVSEREEPIPVPVQVEATLRKRFSPYLSLLRQSLWQAK